MAGASTLILLLVVINQAVIRDSRATSSPDSSTSSGADSPANSLEQMSSMAALSDGDTSTGVGGSLVTDLERQQQLRTLLSKLEQLNQIRSMDLAMNSRDDDHSNIELDKLNEAHRYEVVPTVLIGNGLASVGRQQGDSYNLARLASKILTFNRSNELMRNQMERKRNFREQLASNKKDKNYSFVAAPLRYLPVVGAAELQLQRQLESQQQQQQQRRAGKWATQKLRDIILANGPAFRFATNPTDNLDQLSQVNMRLFAEPGNIEASNDIMPKNREKRRRCKIDPNMGVKNPSFCDTDAYFGAADYSMRDVWDSAGR